MSNNEIQRLPTDLLVKARQEEAAFQMAGMIQRKLKLPLSSVDEWMRLWRLMIKKPTGGKIG